MSISFVGFFDILGFKNMVEKNNHDDLMEIYNTTLYETLDITDRFYDPIYDLITPEGEKESLDIKTYVISDSIILVQKNMTKRGFLNFIAKCQVLLSSCLVDGIPLRGGISYGPVTILENKRGTTIVGLGLTKAYSIEASQQWSGAIIDKECFGLFPNESAESLIANLVSNKQNPLIIKYNIPLKEGKFKVGYGLNWPQNDLLKTESIVINSFTKHKKEVSSSKKELMIENTVKYYTHVMKLLQP